MSNESLQTSDSYVGLPAGDLELLPAQHLVQTQVSMTTAQPSGAPGPGVFLTCDSMVSSRSSFSSGEEIHSERKATPQSPPASDLVCLTQAGPRPTSPRQLFLFSGTSLSLAPLSTLNIQKKKQKNKN